MNFKRFNLELSNMVIFGYIIFFGGIILKYILFPSSAASFVESMSLSETADADSLRTDVLSGKVNTLQPIVDSTSKNVNDNATNIKSTMDTITTVLKQKVNDVNKKIGKDITDKGNVPTISSA